MNEPLVVWINSGNIENLVTRQQYSYSISHQGRYSVGRIVQRPNVDVYFRPTVLLSKKNRMPFEHEH